MFIAGVAVDHLLLIEGRCRCQGDSDQAGSAVRPSISRTFDIGLGSNNVLWMLQEDCVCSRLADDETPGESSLSHLMNLLMYLQAAYHWLLRWLIIIY